MKSETSEYIYTVMRTEFRFNFVMDISLLPSFSPSSTKMR